MVFVNQNIAPDQQLEPWTLVIVEPAPSPNVLPPPQGFLAMQDYVDSARRLARVLEGQEMQFGAPVSLSHIFSNHAEMMRGMLHSLTHAYSEPVTQVHYNVPNALYNHYEDILRLSNCAYSQSVRFPEHDQPLSLKNLFLARATVMRVIGTVLAQGLHDEAQIPDDIAWARLYEQELKHQPEARPHSYPRSMAQALKLT